MSRPLKTAQDVYKRQPEEYLPTFNSHTIEMNLHRIKGLSEQFVYFNDDMFINKPMKPRDFFVHGKPCDTDVYKRQE